MSISASLANALTGLTAASRAAELVSSNVANSMTEGYARRELELSPRFTGSIGAGVQVDGVRRIVDEVTLRERRLAGADVGFARAGNEFYEDVFLLLGAPGETGSLTSLQTELEASLLSASSRPDSDSRLSAVLTDAVALTRKFNQIGDGLQGLREDADDAIGVEVERLNSTLQRIADLNGEILRLRPTNASYPDLLDQRQMLVDEISETVPIRQLARENGTIALYSMGGALLLDVTPATFGFQPTAPITADMTLESGALSGLTLNGNVVDTRGGNGAIAGGRLAGLFEVRDRYAPDVQANLDEAARDLVARFQSGTLDPTLGPGDPGLFTDAGAPLDPARLEGLSSRLSVNALVDPSRGGGLWRLRDGLGALTPGPVGENTLLVAFTQVMSEARPPLGGTFGPAGRSAGDFVASVTSDVTRQISATGSQLSYSSARFDSLRNSELSNGVDTDQEMQKLLLIEQAYAANARVIQTIDDLIQTLIGI